MLSTSSNYRSRALKSLPEHELYTLSEASAPLQNIDGLSISHILPAGLFSNEEGCPLYHAQRTPCGQIILLGARLGVPRQFLLFQLTRDRQSTSDSINQSLNQS